MDAAPCATRGELDGGVTGRRGCGKSCEGGAGSGAKGRRGCDKSCEGGGGGDGESISGDCIGRGGGGSGGGGGGGINARDGRLGNGGGDGEVVGGGLGAGRTSGAEMVRGAGDGGGAGGGGDGGGDGFDGGGWNVRCLVDGLEGDGVAPFRTLACVAHGAKSQLGAWRETQEPSAHCCTSIMQN